MKKKRPARAAARTLFFLFFPVVAGVFHSGAMAQERREEPWVASIYFENDLFTGTDRNYTNGIKLSVLSPDLEKFEDSGITGSLLKVSDWLPFINRPDLRRKVELAMGQNIYTPADTSRHDLIVDDRPYAGWSYFSTAFHAGAENFLHTFEIQVGIVGPESFAAETQKAVHDLRGLPRPNGWEHQLKNEPGIALIYERKWRLPEEPGIGWDVDSVIHLGMAIGNVHTYANAGIEVRWGWNLPENFGVSLIRPAGSTGFSHGKNFTVYLFGAADGRAVARDIFLDGNTLAHSHSVTRKPFVADLAAGAAATYRNIKISWAQVLRTREFDGQPDDHSFGAVTISCFF